MAKIKTFWEKNKKKIYTIGGLVAVTIIGGVIVAKLGKSGSYKRTETISVNHLTWPEGDGSTMDFERAKELFEKNRFNNSKFAIIKEMADVDKYITVVIDGDFET